MDVVCDVRDPDAVQELADRTYRDVGPVRLLVNNAGVEQFGYLWDTPVANWLRVVDINISGVFYGVRAFLPKMMATDEQAWVWNLSSVGGVVAIPLQAPYIMSKHAVLALTECLHLDVQSAGTTTTFTCRRCCPARWYPTSSSRRAASTPTSQRRRSRRGAALGHARHQGRGHGSAGGRRDGVRAGRRGPFLPAHPAGSVGSAMAERANVLASQRPPVLRTRPLRPRR